jgi:tetratricopeptide (TPR) repeat protein
MLCIKRENTSKLLTHGSVLKTNQHSSELYFNLGNCYYKLNKVAPAIYSYEKVSAESNDKEILNNLKFAQKRTIDEVKVIPKSDLESCFVTLPNLPL